MDDLSIINELGKRLISSYKNEPTVDPLLDDPVRNLYWGPYPGGNDYWGMDGTKYDDGVTDSRTGLLKAVASKVAKEINGYFCPSAGSGATPGKRVQGFFNATPSLGTLQENGGTSCGNWLYCYHYVNPGDDANAPDGNRMARRVTTEVTRADGKYIGLYSNWSAAWPLNRRIIYNGASYIQTTGYPLAPEKWVLWYAGEWKAGGDVPDGMTTPNARYPFIMLPEGHARLFGPGLEDGPFPEHYEPWETVMTEHSLAYLAGESPRAPISLSSPTLFAHARPERVEHPGNGNPDFPIIGTTYRLIEHWQAGAMTRNLPWLCQLQPEPFVEISDYLAGILGISNGDIVEIKTQRTEAYGRRMLAKACVTKRFKKMKIMVDGTLKDVHVIGTIWHFGYQGCCTGDSANLLTPHIGDANTGIPETKNFICNIRKYPGGSWLS